MTLYYFLVSKYVFALCQSIINMEFQNIKDIKLIKRKGYKIICFSFVRDNTAYFGKLIHIDMRADFVKERDINLYINDNIKNDKYHTRIQEVYENITLPINLLILLLGHEGHSKVDAKYNLMVFEYSGKHPLRYYINKLSRTNFDKIINQIREATSMLNSIGVIHYDMYCESNVMLKKVGNQWVIKIIDYGLSYIDLTDKTDSDYYNIIESIEHFCKKHIIS